MHGLPKAITLIAVLMRDDILAYPAHSLHSLIDPD